MYRDLTGLQRKRHGGGFVNEGRVQVEREQRRTTVARFRSLIDMSMKAVLMAARQNAKATVVIIHCVECKPDCDDIMRPEWPVISVLMPRHIKTFPRSLRHHVRTPLIEIRTKDVFNTVEYSWVHNKIE